MFDAEAPLLPAGREKARTPFQVVIARFREYREELPKPESPLVWVLELLSRIQPGNEFIAVLEVSLLELVFPRSNAWFWLLT